MNRWRSATLCGSASIGVWIMGGLVALGGCEARDKDFVEEWSKACSGGDLARCADLGETYLTGLGTTRDTSKGIEILRKACTSDGAHACTVLAQAYARGDGVAKDTHQAVALMGKACENGDEQACLRGCEESKEAVRCLRVGLLSAKGAKDLKRAATYYRRACELGHPLGCREAGFMYQDGNGVNRDPTLAGELLKRADELMRTACAAPNRPDYCDL